MVTRNEGLVENAAAMGRHFLERLRQAVGDHPFVADVRGDGLMLAVEFMADKVECRPFAAAAGAHRVVAKKAIEQGVLVRPLPFIEVIAFSPALSITMAEIDEAVAAFSRGLAQATPELRRLANA